jgi:hypothetical protein
MTTNFIMALNQNPEKFIHRVSNEFIRMMAHLFFAPLTHPNPDVQMPSEPQVANSALQQQLCSLLARTFKKATGHSIEEISQNLSQSNAEQNDKVLRDLEILMIKIIIQELSNFTKNMHLSLRKAYGVPHDQIASTMAEHYCSQTGYSLQVEATVKGLLALEHNANVVWNLDSVQNPAFRLIQQQLQRHIHAVLDGANLPAMRQALRTVREQSLGHHPIVSATSENASLKSFARYKELQNSRALGGRMPETQTVEPQRNKVKLVSS